MRSVRSGPVRVAVAGCGRWGVNFVRVLRAMPECRLVGIADPDRRAIGRFPSLVRGISVFSRPATMIGKLKPRAVVVATPASSHDAVVRTALEHGADVLVEKPLATSAPAARGLVALARRRKLLLMVGHIFHYNPAVEMLRRYVSRGRLGALRYLYAVRTNLGPIRKDVDVLWDLAAHDVSMMIGLTGEVPERVSATGRSYIRPPAADVAFGTLFFRRRKAIGHLHVSWLDPHKVRRLTVIGARRMAVFDDADTREPLRIYDRGVANDKAFGDFGQFQLMLRDGDIHAPRVSGDEPLRAECRHFVRSVLRRGRPLTGGVHGLDVVRVLEALSSSLARNGRPASVRR